MVCDWINADTVKEFENLNNIGLFKKVGCWIKDYDIKEDLEGEMTNSSHPKKELKRDLF